MSKETSAPTFYVDAITAYPPEAIRSAQARRTSRDWCHLWTDGTPDQLHEFAARLGMKRAWFQPHRLLPHYDLVPARRAAAIRLGAVEKPVADYLREMRAGGVVPNQPQDRHPMLTPIEEMIPHAVLAKMPAPERMDVPRALPGKFVGEKPDELRFGGSAYGGRTTVRVAQERTMDLFAARPAPLASRLQPLLLFAARFVERHARRAEGTAQGTLALVGREQHLDADLQQRMEAAVLEVMTKTLARCLPEDRDYACAAFYRPGRHENAQWVIEVHLWNSKTHGSPRRLTGSDL